MEQVIIEPFYDAHTHIFNDGNPLAEQRTKWAVLLTLIVMVAEIAGGYIFNSMALLADGWHMSSHALALGLSVLGYIFARHYAKDARFSFGTWKIEILAGYTSAIMLMLIAGLMFVHSVERLMSPKPIHYNEAIWIAILGLATNLLCAWLLKDSARHHHEHGEHHHHESDGHDHEDLNLRSAYLHVLVDAMTSVLAIIALILGKFWGADWLDPIMGIVGAILIVIWGKGLISQTGRVLLDAEMDAPVVQEIQEVINELNIPVKIHDLHVWRVGRGKYACILSVITQDAFVTPDYFREKIGIHEELVHITVEVRRAS